MRTPETNKSKYCYLIGLNPESAKNRQNSLGLSAVGNRQNNANRPTPTM